MKSFLSDGTGGFVEPSPVFRWSRNFHGRKKLMVIDGGFPKGLSNSTFNSMRISCGKKPKNSAV
jgi:hypothetical protein